LGTDVIDSLVSTYGHMYAEDTTNDDPEATSNRVVKLQAAAYVIAEHRKAGLVGSDFEIAEDILGNGEGSRKCKHEDVSDEEYQARLAEIEDHSGGGRHRRAWGYKDRLVINLIFHVVHSGTSYNAETAMINEQVAVLNEAYGGKSHSLGVNSRIQFKIMRLSGFRTLRTRQNARTNLIWTRPRPMALW